MKHSQKLKRPRTNQERRDALNKPLRVLEATPPSHWLIDSVQSNQLPDNTKRFKAEFDERNNLIEKRRLAVKERIEVRDHTRLYIQHFFQSFCNAIKREDLPLVEGTYFGLIKGEMPSIGTNEEQVVMWGEILVKGEKKRKQDGLNPVQGPDLQEVEDQIERFELALKASAKAQADYNLVHNAFIEWIPELDDFLEDMWDTILYNLRHLPQPQVRRMARDWGLVWTSTAIPEDEPESLPERDDGTPPISSDDHEPKQSSDNPDDSSTPNNEQGGESNG